jgi:hypothetical protein
MCTDMTPGIAFPDGGTPPDYLSCGTIPNECTATPTCDCVVTALKKGSFCYPSACKADAQGNLTVTCMGA